MYWNPVRYMTYGLREPTPPRIGTQTTAEKAHAFVCDHESGKQTQ